MNSQYSQGPPNQQRPSLINFEQRPPVNNQQPITSPQPMERPAVYRQEPPQNQYQSQEEEVNEQEAINAVRRARQQNQFFVFFFCFL